MDHAEKQVHGRVDGPSPEKKLKDFLKVKATTSAGLEIQGNVMVAPADSSAASPLRSNDNEICSLSGEHGVSDIQAASLPFLSESIDPLLPQVLPSSGHAAVEPEPQSVQSVPATSIEALQADVD